MTLVGKPLDMADWKGEIVFVLQDVPLCASGCPVDIDENRRMGRSV